VVFSGRLTMVPLAVCPTVVRRNGTGGELPVARGDGKQVKRERFAMAEGSVMEKIVSLCKRRGFVYPASEIYGGLNGFWDYGPLGVLLKNNIRDSWWRNMVECPPVGPDGHPVDMVGVDTAIIQNPKTWVAS